jgi:hypothetical protein
MDVRFEVLTKASMKMAVFWVVALLAHLRNTFKENVYSIRQIYRAFHPVRQQPSRIPTA